jgi:hypothetical protein
MRTFLRFNLLAAAAMAALLFVSCEKNDPETKPEPQPEPQPEPPSGWVQDKPGKIPGLGNTKGEPTGTPFTLPDGVETAGKIIGGEHPSVYYYQSAGKRDDLLHPEFIRRETVWTRADADATHLDTIVGSGMLHVRIFIPLKNTSPRDTSVTFPAGLIIKSVTGRCQNGLLLKKTTVDVPAKGVCGVLLIMYCGNEDRSTSLEGEEYVFEVVSNSAPVMDLCERVKNKRINTEEYPPGQYGGYTDDEQYQAYALRLQDMVWKLTDWGEPLSEEDLAYIEQMENSR